MCEIIGSVWDYYNILIKFSKNPLLILFCIQILLPFAKIYGFGQNISKVNISYHTKGGSNNWRTIENPNVTRINPKLISNNKQQTPFVFGQHGFGAAIVSTKTPRLFAAFSDIEAAGRTEE